MNKSDSSIATNKISNDKLIFLKKYPLISATAIIGVKFGGWGINLANDKINTNPMGKICLFMVFKKSCINLIYTPYTKIKRSVHLRIVSGSFIFFI